MKIVFYSYQTKYSKITLPVCLPGNTLFPSGKLPGLGVLKYFICFLHFSLPGNDRQANKGKSKSLGNCFENAPFDIFPSGSPSGSLPGSREIFLEDADWSPWVSLSSSGLENMLPGKRLPVCLPVPPGFPSGKLPGMQVFELSDFPNFLKKQIRANIKAYSL